MYKKLLLGIAMCIVVFMANAQTWTPGTYLQQAMRATLGSAHLMEITSTTLGFARGNNFMGAFLQVGGSVSYRTTLVYGKKYAFIGGGDNDATDIDITVTSPSGTEYKDVKPDKVPIVQFTAYSSGEYTIKLSMPAASRQSFCCLAILIEGGYAISENTLSTTVNKMINYANSVNSTTSQTINFHDLSNQWCLFGGFVNKGESVSVSSLNLGYLDHIVIASGDNNINDLDLCVYRNSTAIVCDRDDDPRPYTSLTSYGSGYEITAKNYDSDARSFVMFCILTKY
jgi:hypothetical protein